jgi:hypothetical protein
MVSAIACIPDHAPGMAGIDINRRNDILTGAARETDDEHCCRDCGGRKN